jgi:hypothetical protein
LGIDGRIVVRLSNFRVYNFRNVHDSGPIETTRVTAFVGQNEAGKSNLFEALYRINPFDGKTTYDINEDWPVDKWGDKDPLARVCEAQLELDSKEISALFVAARIPPPASEPTSPAVVPPAKLVLFAHSQYGAPPKYFVDESLNGVLDSAKVQDWAQKSLPKFVLIHDFEMSGSQIELNALQQRKSQVSWNQLSVDEQTILIVLELARVNLDDFISKGTTPQGRTTRSFDKRAASAYLSERFRDLWRQKDVRFDIDIDGTTLNIFAEDTGVGMPVRLSRRSTGFRWHVAFAWKFTHASGGEFKNCILLLEEPGIHLHYSAQADLLQVFERLKEANTILYTTHLASMVDLAFPERIRIVESDRHHAKVKHGVVSSQKAPMAVIEMSLGLTGDMSGLLGNRKTLIVEGGDDALILQKLSGMLKSAGREGLSDSIYLWPAMGAPKTPMYAAFAIGQKWESGVLLDTDREGKLAREKIQDLYLSKLAEADRLKFRIFMLGDAAGINKTDAAIEDLFPDDYYVGLVNRAYGLSIQMSDLPVDGSDMITKRVEVVLQRKYGHSALDKQRVIGEMLKTFDSWNRLADIPPDTIARAESLFKRINGAFQD